MIELAWAAIIALSIVMYVVLDGYDLGIGILLLFERRRGRRRRAIEIVATAWDGNESWLILLGVALWAGFPGAYAILVPHAYVPLIAMLFGLILRGVSIEMVTARPRRRAARRWTGLFIAGSLVAAFAQGVIFGATTQVIPVVDGTAASGGLDVFTPFTILTGLATMALYAAFGAAYLRIKTVGRRRLRTRTEGRIFIVLAGFLAVLSALSLGATGAPLNLASPPRVIVFTLLVVVIAAAACFAFVVFSSHDEKRVRMPFMALVALTVAGFLAYAAGRYPVVLPPSLTIQQAAAPENTLVFVLIGVGLNVPLLLFYAWFSHRVFRGPFRRIDRPRGRSITGQALEPDREAVGAERVPSERRSESRPGPRSRGGQGATP